MLPLVSALVGSHGTPYVLDRQQQDCHHAQHVELGELFGPPEVRRVSLEDLLDHDQKTGDGEKACCESGWKTSPFLSRDPKRRNAGNRECGKWPPREVDQREQAGAEGGHHR